MARIRTYALDNNVTGSDYWIGTDGNDNSNTKNFSPNSVAKYLNENEIIDVSNSIRFKYDTIDSGQQRKEGTLSFQNEIGATVPMEDLTSFVLSKKTQSGKDVSFFLNVLPTTKVILHKSNDINLFGLYKVLSVENDILEPNFFNVSLEFISGHGSIEEDKDYIISLIDLDKTIPILQLTKETFNYASSSSFTLSNTIGNILQVIINATSLHPEGYSYTLPSTVTILNELHSGDVITIVYNYLEEFLEVPDLQRVTNVGNHTTNNIIIDNTPGEWGNYTTINTISKLGAFQSYTSPTDTDYQSEYVGDGMSINEIYSPTEYKFMTISSGLITTSLTHLGGLNVATINSGSFSVGPSLELTKNANSGKLMVDNIVNDIVLQFPDKPEGTYTIATTADVTHSALVFLDDGNGNGIVISGRDPLNYGNVGLNAVDLSYNDSTSSTWGALGENSFAFGSEITSNNYGSISFGYNIFNNGLNSFNNGYTHRDAGYTNFLTGSGHDVTSMNTTVVGQASNIIASGIDDFNAYITKPLFVVGNGTINNSTFDVITRSDAFIVRMNGLATLPSVTNSLIEADTTGKAIVTKEYVNNRLVVETTSGYTLTNADSGGIVIFKTTAAQTLTIPTGLADGFECTFVTLSGVTLTVPAVAGITLNNATYPTGSNTLLPQLSFTLKRMLAANTYIATGGI